MPNNWGITAEWEYLASGSPEERACFAALSLFAHGHCLTEGQDALANRLRKAPYLSAYHLAEWLAWNWWRLRWEPRAHTPDWVFAHRLANIGEGYIWPDVTLFSDGQRTALISKGTDERPETPFRYINSTAVVIPAADFETGLDDFIRQVLARLDAADVRGSNLAQIWREVESERQDPAASLRRIIEALLGCDPDEADPDILERLLRDADQLGTAAIEELAANAGYETGSAGLTSAAELNDIAQRFGVDGVWDDGVCPTSFAPAVDRGQTPAWQLGTSAARALRQQENLGSGLVDDRVLASMLGANPDILKASQGAFSTIAFALDQTDRANRIVLRSRWNTGRRFELARLLGDRLLADPGNRLYPATRAYTYRQKMQRAFAAELLSPYESVLTMLDGDTSPENQQEVANYFQVSDWTIRSLLVNNEMIDRNHLDGEQFALFS
ncbi:hypothetical protein [uncultured Thiocystis sp.]|jgi:hypothetical protein|uniref:ImmA/IrrE family metallo-endopeptidase n=1 Tax=uncultured Thiocystis sp. TaxID=1202134 RepID=UPI0025DF8D08|nr:hypothetical protein [uncultured Thiocystis sp.]